MTDIRKARELLLLCDVDDERSIIQAPEDDEIDRLCQRLGYGAVMDAAARLWRRRDPNGAFTVGLPVALLRQLHDCLQPARKELEP